MITMTMMTLVKPGVVGEVLNISSSRECLTGSCCSLEPGQTRDKVDSPAPPSSLSQSSHLSDYVEIQEWKEPLIWNVVKVQPSGRLEELEAIYIQRHRLVSLFYVESLGYSPYNQGVVPQCRRSLLIGRSLSPLHTSSHHVQNLRQNFTDFSFSSFKITSRPRIITSFHVMVMALT